MLDGRKKVKRSQRRKSCTPDGHLQTTTVRAMIDAQSMGRKERGSQTKSIINKRNSTWT